MSQPITLVQRVFLSAVSAPEVVERAIVDLGLAIGECARILAVDMELDVAVTAQETSYGQLGLSYEPEVAPNPMTDDDTIAMIRSRFQSGNATYESLQTSVHRFFNFRGLNMVTANKMSIVCSTVGATDAPAFNCSVAVFYEKFKPSTQDLNELIAYRR